MKVADILAQKETQVYSIHPDRPVSEALQLLNKKRIGSLLVLDDEQNIKGIITERDLLYMYADAKYQAGHTLVKEIMTPAEKLIIGHPSDDLEYVMQMMTDHHIRHLPILSDEGKLITLISIRDVIKMLFTDAVHEKKLLLDYIQGKYPA